MSAITDVTATRPRSSRLGRKGLFLVLVVALVLAAGTGAWAYWTSTGSGSGAASSGTLNSPTAVSGSSTAGTGTVSVTWTAPSSGTSPTGYYVKRTKTSDSSVAFACSTSASSLVSAVSCSDTSVPDGTYTYVVTAVYNSWSASSQASSPIAVTNQVATKLAFTTQPSASVTSQSPFAVQPVVAVQDAGGNTMTANTSSVSLALTASPVGASLTCASNPKAAVSGVATFAGCQVDKVGTYTLTATDGSLTSAESTTFTVAPGAASKLDFSVQPAASSASQVAFASQPSVSVLDGFGNVVTSDSSTVTLTLTTSGGAALGCTPTNAKAASSGVAAFSGCKIDRAGTYTLTASDGTLTTAVSSSFSITVGAASKLVFTAQPGNGTGGSILAAQPSVTVQDAGGNTVTGSSAPITLVASGGAGALSCSSNPLSATSGVAAFSGCSVDKTGTYTLTASSGSLGAASSNPFTISVGTANKLVFSQQPSSTGTGGTPLATQPKVTVQDAGGNTVTSDTSQISLALTTPNGATLSCAGNPQAAVNGVATFAGCAIDKAQGTAYTLTASSGTLVTAVSNGITISVGSAAKLAFTAQPGNGTGGSALGAQPTVTVQDAGGNTVTGNTAPITLALTTAAGGTLTCTSNPRNAVSGVDTFSGCKVDKANTYTLTASATGLTSATSTSFVVSVGAATQLSFGSAPSGSTISQVAFATQPVVVVQDAGGNTVTGDSSSVSLALTSAGGATLTCTANPKTAVSGSANFSGCKVDKVGTYTFTASDGSLTAAVSGSFSITAGTASKLAFTTQPGNGTGGANLATQPVVTVQDASGNTVLTDSSSVTLALSSAGGATLTCTTNPLAASAGLATFAGCKVDKTGSYTLTATDGSLTSAMSSSFTVSVGAAAKLAFTAAPSGSTTSQVAFTTQPAVTVQDAGGNTVTGDSSNVTLALTTPGGATLTCTTNQKAAASGVATFAGCKVDKVGTYTLTATDGALTSAVSGSFAIVAGAPAQLKVSGPVSGNNASTPNLGPYVVQVVDAGGNVVNATSAVTVGLSATGNGAGSPTFSTTQNTGGTTNLNLTIASGASTSANFYYGWSQNNKTTTIKASATGFADGTLVVAIN